MILDMFVSDMQEKELVDKILELAKGAGATCILDGSGGTGRPGDQVSLSYTIRFPAEPDLSPEDVAVTMVPSSSSAEGGGSVDEANKA